MRTSERDAQCLPGVSRVYGPASASVNRHTQLRPRVGTQLPKGKTPASSYAVRTWPADGSAIEMLPAFTDVNVSTTWRLADEPGTSPAIRTGS